MNRRLSGSDPSLNAKISSEDGAEAEWQDWLVEDSPNQEEEFQEKEEEVTPDDAKKCLDQILDVAEWYVDKYKSQSVNDEEVLHTSERTIVGPEGKAYQATFYEIEELENHEDGIDPRDFIPKDEEVLQSSGEAVGASPNLDSTAFQQGEVFSIPGLSLDLIWCVPGTFEMGSPFRESDRKPDEELNTVTLTQGFWLGKY